MTKRQVKEIYPDMKYSDSIYSEIETQYGTIKLSWENGYEGFDDTPINSDDKRLVEIDYSFLKGD